MWFMRRMWELPFRAHKKRRNERTANFMNNRIYRIIQWKLEATCWYDELWQNYKVHFKISTKIKISMWKPLKCWEVSILWYLWTVSVDTVQEKMTLFSACRVKIWIDCNCNCNCMSFILLDIIFIRCMNTFSM